MKSRDIAIFCALLLLLALTGTLSGCASKQEPQPTPLPTAKLTPIPNDGGMLFANTKAADQLAAILAGRMEPAYGVLVTSLVSMDNLAEAPHFGRMLMQQISSRLSQHGFKMLEARLADTMIINKQGEFMLSREAGTRLAKEYNAYAVLVGLYSRVGNQLYISTRVLRLGDSAVLAAYEYSLPQYLVAPGAVAAGAPVATASAVAVAPGTASAAAAQGVAIRPSYTPSAPRPVTPVPVPVPVAAAVDPCAKGVNGEDALWERYAGRGQAFAHCERAAPKPQASSSSRRTSSRSQSKPTGKPAAKPAAKPAPALEDLLGKDPVCPPGCVPAPKVDCPPGCVPATGAAGAAVTPRPAAPAATGQTSGQTATPSPAATGGPAPVTVVVTPAPVVVTPSEANAPASVTVATPPASAEGASVTITTPAASSATPPAASTPGATPSPVASPVASPAASSGSATPGAPAFPPPAGSPEDGSAPAAAPATGIPAPAASQLGQFGQ